MLVAVPAMQGMSEVRPLTTALTSLLHGLVLSPFSFVLVPRVFVRHAGTSLNGRAPVLYAEDEGSIPSVPIIDEIFLRKARS